jgi:HEAT repeat protein
MADAPEGGKKIGTVWYALTALAVVAIAIWALYFPKRQSRKPIGAIVSQLEQGDPEQRMATLRGLYVDVAGETEFAQVLPYLIQATTDESEMVRHEAAAVIGSLITRYGGMGQQMHERDSVIVALCPRANEALARLLDETSPSLRATAAKSLGYVADMGRLDAPPPRLLACLDDESEQVRAAAATAVIAYRQGPELLVPVALRRIPSESQVTRTAFEWVFQVRLQPAVLPLLIEGLSSDNVDVRHGCTTAINHMGRDAGPALPAILKLLRKELETPDGPAAHPGIIAMAAGAIGEISPDGAPDPGTIELLSEVLKHPGEERQAEAAWSLGIFGRASASAVPLLITTFEAGPAAPKEAANTLRQVTAEALVEITRGTHDEDRVIATLAKALKTAPQEQKAVLARALRSLGPKAEERVPELKQLPADTTPSQIRRVRYPRSRFEEPARESQE